MIEWGPGFLAVVWYKLQLPPPPCPSASCLSLSVFLCVSGRASWREGRGYALSRIIRQQESLALYKLFKTLWGGATPPALFFLIYSIFFYIIQRVPYILCGNRQCQALLAGWWSLFWATFWLSSPICFSSPAPSSTKGKLRLFNYYIILRQFASQFPAKELSKAFFQMCYIQAILSTIWNRWQRSVSCYDWVVQKKPWYYHVADIQAMPTSGS